MQLAFESKRLRSICENEGEAEHEFGVAVAESLKHRLADFHAALSPKDLIAGSPRLTDDCKSMTVDLSNGYHIIFAANHVKQPLTESNQLDWNKVSRIKILSVENDNA